MGLFEVVDGGRNWGCGSKWEKVLLVGSFEKWKGFELMRICCLNERFFSTEMFLCVKK